jgi:hypothetical protein
MRSTMDPARQCIDRLRLNDEQHRQLVQMLDQKAEQPTGRDLRREPRYPYVVPAGLTIEVRHPENKARQWQPYLVRPRNISKHGLGFFHSSFLYQHTLCQVWLQTVDGQTLTRQAEVRHCRHILSAIHEIGVAFYEPLDLSQLIGGATEASREAAGMGRAICVEGQAEARTELIKHLQSLDVQAFEASDACTALQQVEQMTPNLLIVGEQLPDATPDDVMTSCQEAGFQGPIVRWTRDRANTKEGVAGTLPRPAGVDAVGEMLENQIPRLAQHQGPLPPDNDDSDKPAEPTMAFLQKLDEHALTLQTALSQGALSQAEPTARELADQAGGCGYQALARLGQQAVDQLQDDDAQARPAVRAMLLNVLRAGAFRAQGAGA